MNAVITLVVILVALEHVYFLVFEMMLWTKPRGRKISGLNEQFAKETQKLAANQGLYNGFLAAGLFWSVLHPDANFAYQLQLFFLGCILVAAVFGALTVNRTILLIQGLPALLALFLVLLSLF